jgi:hypothetical protein
MSAATTNGHAAISATALDTDTTFNSADPNANKRKREDDHDLLHPPSVSASRLHQIQPDILEVLQR